MNRAQLNLIKLGIDLAVAAGYGLADAVVKKKLVERLVAEGRDPTPEEWAELNVTTDALHQAIQGA